MDGPEHLDPLVAKQLTKLGLSLDQPPDLASWRRFLARVGNHYRHVDDDRQLLMRSLERSSHEMNQLQARLSEEHGRMRQLVAVISQGLQGFHEVVSKLPASATDAEVSQVTSTIHEAKERLSQKLGEMVAASEQSSWPRDQAEHIHREFSFISDQLLELVQLTAQRAGMHKDLEVARAVQYMLVPGGDVIVRPGLSLAGYFQPAAQCGGDWWSTYDLPGGKVLVVIGDVTGHGVAPAIMTGVAKASCDVAFRLMDQEITCAQVLDVLNRGIFESAQQTLFMTCMASIFDPGTRTLTLANAGHPFPFLSRRKGPEAGLRRLISPGAPLGTAAESQYQILSVDLEDEDVIIWFTDGITDSEREDGTPFGERRMRHAVQQAGSSDPVEVRDRILGEVIGFCGGKEPPDDMAMVVGCVRT